MYRDPVFIVAYSIAGHLVLVRRKHFAKFAYHNPVAGWRELIAGETFCLPLWKPLS